MQFCHLKKKTPEGAQVTKVNHKIGVYNLFYLLQYFPSELSFEILSGVKEHA